MEASGLNVAGHHQPSRLGQYRWLLVAGNELDDLLIVSPHAMTGALDELEWYRLSQLSILVHVHL